jgi:hypothetical protein
MIYDCVCYAGKWIIGSRKELDKTMVAINGSKRVCSSDGIASSIFASDIVTSLHIQ